MSNYLYKKIPLQNKDKLCPYCGRRIEDYRVVQLIAYGIDLKVKTFKANLPYCEKCDLPSSDGKINMQLNQRARCSVELISLKKRQPLKEIKKEIIADGSNLGRGHSYYELTPAHLVSRNNKNSAYTYLKLLNDDDEQFEHDFDEYCEANYKTFHKTYELRLLKSGQKSCAQCNDILKPQNICLPVNRGYCYEMQGLECEKCELLYVKSLNHVVDLLNGNSDNRGRKITIGNKDYNCYIDGTRLEYLHLKREKKRREEIAEEERIQRIFEQEEKQIEQKYREKLKSVSTAVAMIIVTYRDNKESVEYIIVSDSKHENKGNHILYYENDVAMELLTAAFVSSRYLKGNNCGRIFDVKRKIMAGDSIPQIALKNVNIETDGGFLSSIRNPHHHHIVNILMYSPFTKRLEKIRATLDDTNNKCYTDMFLFRQFAHKYGNPGIDYTFISNNKEFREFSDLNAESILKVMGYSVSRNDNLSAEKRRNVLMDIVDLKILSVHGVIHYLEFFINTHTNSSYEDARSKWNEDMCFIASYKANPDRFLIAQ